MNSTGYGAAMRQYVPGRTPAAAADSQFLLWEIALETARRAVAPEAPSRLACVFVYEELDQARVFRDRYRAGGHILIVEPHDLNAKRWRADPDHLTGSGGTPFVDYMPEAAFRYWTEPASNHVEMLLAGPVRVVGIVPGASD